MDLSSEERKIILKIIEDPMISISQIAKELKISRPTAHSYYKRLKSKFKVQTVFNLEQLGLKRLHYIFECPFEQLQVLEAVIAEFPYSYYRTRLVGPLKGLLVQFTIPTSLSLDSFLSMLKQKGLIRHVLDVSPQSPSVFSNFQLTAFNERTSSFDFDWAHFKSKLTSYEPHYPVALPTVTHGSILHELEPLDMYILSSLTEDARKRGTALLNPAGETYSNQIPSYVISRRVNFLKENIRHYYKVQLDWDLFNIYQPLIFLGNAPVEVQAVNSLAKSIQTDFPFDSLFYLTSNNGDFFWYVAFPPSHLPSMMAFIWELTKGHFDMYSVDYRSSDRYLFYGYHNFDFTARQWKVSETFLLSGIEESSKQTGLDR